MIANLIKPERDPDLNPVDYWNMHGSWIESIPTNRQISIHESKLVCERSRTTIAHINTTHLTVQAENALKLPEGKILSKFSVLARCKFSHNYRSAMAWIEYKHLNKEIPYIRVGSDYFKIINKKDRYGTLKKEIKPWKKDEVKQDIGAAMLNYIQKYDDFIMEPDNKNHSPVIGSCYNMYSAFNHTTADSYTQSDIAYSMHLMNHIFGEQIDLGLQYMKVLYEMPRQALPILCLVSKERQTGKTTFLNWIDMIFGDNFVQIDPQALVSDFNAVYASKNIIGVDETVISDKNNAVEKLKAISTQKSITVNQKHVSQYRLPFFGKIIINSNKETEFIKIDQEETRFWVRKVGSIDNIYTDIEDKLWKEIPYFLKFIESLPAIDTTRSRMIFTREQIATNYLQAVVTESKPWLYKELHILFADWFVENPTVTEFMATPTDIKFKFFSNDKNLTIAYIGKVLKDDFGLLPGKMIKYTPFDTGKDPYGAKKAGKPYQFVKEMFYQDEVIYSDETVPF